MTYDQYWHGDPWLVRDYLKAEEYRRERENHNAWLSGLYVAQAIDSTVGNAFRKENDSPAEYPEKPIPLYGEAEESDEEREAKEQKEADAAELYLKQFVEFGKNWGKNKDQSPPSA